MTIELLPAFAPLPPNATPAQPGSRDGLDFGAWLADPQQQRAGVPPAPAPLPLVIAAAAAQAEPAIAAPAHPDATSAETVFAIGIEPPLPPPALLYPQSADALPEPPAAPLPQAPVANAQAPALAMPAAPLPAVPAVEPDALPLLLPADVAPPHVDAAPALQVRAGESPIIVAHTGNATAALPQPSSGIEPGATPTEPPRIDARSLPAPAGPQAAPQLLPAVAAPATAAAEPVPAHAPPHVADRAPVQPHIADTAPVLPAQPAAVPPAPQPHTPQASPRVPAVPPQPALIAQPAPHAAPQPFAAAGIVPAPIGMPAAPVASPAVDMQPAAPLPAPAAAATLPVQLPAPPIVFEFHVRTAADTVEVVSVPWRLAPTGRLSYRSDGAAAASLADAHDGARIPQARAKAPAAQPQRTAFAAPSSLAGDTAAQPLLLPVATHALRPAGDARREIERSSASATIAEPWVARLMRWIERAGHDPAVWIRDYRLDAAGAQGVVDEIRALAQQNGMQLERIVVNARALWQARGETQPET